MRHFKGWLVAGLIVLHSAVGIADAPSADATANLAHIDTDLPLGPILLGSTGLVSVVVGAGFGWQSRQENDRYHDYYEDECGHHVYPNATDEMADKIRQHAITADVFLFTGAALVTGGLIWWLIDRKKRPAAANTTSLLLHPRLTHRGAGLQLEF